MTKQLRNPKDRDAIVAMVRKVADSLDPSEARNIPPEPRFSVEIPATDKKTGLPVLSIIDLVTDERIVLGVI